MPENRKVYIFLLGLLFAGLTLGTVPTSIPQFLLAAYWLFTGSFHIKFRNLKRFPIAILWMLLWLWHLVAMLWTEDVQSGWNDIRIKLPMLLIPLFFCSFSPPDFREFRQIIFFFLTGLTINLVWCNYWLWQHHPEDLRQASRFMSHIRLGYLTATGILLSGYLAVSEKKNQIIYLILITFFLFCLWNLGLLSGFVALLVTLLVFVVWSLFYLKGKIRYVIPVIAMITAMAAVGYVGSFYKSFFTEKNHPYNQKIEGKKEYVHLKDLYIVENGFRADINVNVTELIRAWNCNIKDAPITEYCPEFFGLIRYLASMGYSKDSAGFVRLSPEDIQNIRNGISNYRLKRMSGINKKLYEVLFSFHQWMHRKYIMDSSVGMRMYYWKVAWKVLKKNFLIGCGTGDVFKEMKEYFHQEGVDRTWMKRPHQQFLSIWCALGIPGILIFLCIWFFTFNVTGKGTFLLLVISAMIIFSFLYEDTLETQTGVSFAVFFHVLLGWYYGKKENREGEGVVPEGVEPPTF